MPEIGIDIDAFVFVARFVECNLLAVVHVFAAEKRAFFLNALRRGSDGELAVCLAREFAIRPVHPDHHALVIDERRSLLLSAILILGHARHDRIGGQRLGLGREQHQKEDHFDFFSFSILLLMPSGIPKLPESLAKPSMSMGPSM